MFKAKFKTAYLHRELPMDAVVNVGDPLEVGAAVIVKPATDKLPAYVTEVTADTLDEAVELATHFVAQSDETLEYGHIPVENRDYRYTPEVVSSLNERDFPQFRGVFETVDMLNTVTSPQSGNTALVYKEDGVFTKYTHNGSTWANANKDFTFGEITKKVALFAIDGDVVIYDDEV